MKNILAALILLELRLAYAHGYMETPRQRGILESNPFTTPVPVLTNLAAETYDYKCHFPAGDKAVWPGAGAASQKLEGGSAGWVPYEPWRPGFVFRSGVCGDPKWNLEHIRGGRFYYPKDDPHIVATYNQGDVIDIIVSVVVWHMGYFEFTICDVDKCGGEVSEECLRDSSICQRLIREPVPDCETRTNVNCAPIDPKFPTRWYAPCPYPSYDTVMTWGDGTIKYKLPANLYCKHCVLQWYWVSASECNPPGVANYFNGHRGPTWNHCPDFGGNFTGFGNWEECGETFPEEYYQCADIRVNPIDEVKPTSFVQRTSSSFSGVAHAASLRVLRTLPTYSNMLTKARYSPKANDSNSFM